MSRTGVAHLPPEFQVHDGPGNYDVDPASGSLTYFNPATGCNVTCPVVGEITIRQGWDAVV
jgi:hypothetical protein